MSQSRQLQKIPREFCAALPSDSLAGNDRSTFLWASGVAGMAGPDRQNLSFKIKLFFLTTAALV